MKDEYYNDSVTLLSDGTYRWYYDMDMVKNKSMLYKLEKINLQIFIGLPLLLALLILLAEHDASFARGVILIGLGIGALMALLYWIGFHIASLIMRGNDRISFVMQEEGIKIAWGDRRQEDYGTGKEVAAKENSHVGYHGAIGRRPSRLNLFSNLRFSEILHIKSYPKQDMIDVSVPGGQFQVYVKKEDFEFVEQYIIDHAPKRVQRAI